MHYHDDGDHNYDLSSTNPLKLIQSYQFPTGNKEEGLKKYG